MSNKIKLCAISDLHGYIPEDVPECDILCIAGDIGPNKISQSEDWLKYDFNAWLRRQPVEEVYGVWGNHDWISLTNKIPELHKIKFLNCKQVESKAGLKIWGSPWSGLFGDWAWMLPEIGLEDKYKTIPYDTDIIISHGPPFGFGDLTDKGIRAGSPSLTRRILQIKPKVIITAHIHEDYGIHLLDNIPIINASLLNHKYKMVNKPIIVEL